MAKIENVTEMPRPPRTFVVAVSFSGLDKGARFTLDGDDPWPGPYVAAGYLTEEAPDVRSAESSG